MILRDKAASDVRPSLPPAQETSFSSLLSSDFFFFFLCVYGGFAAYTKRVRDKKTNQLQIGLITLS